MVRAVRRRRWGVGLLLAAAAVGAAATAEGRWTRAQVAALPDEAFAVVEVRPDGTRWRRLPHHDADGQVDLPHVRSALARLGQVNGLDPARVEQARRHLEEHLAEAREARPGGPAPRR